MWSKITSHLGLWLGLDEPDRPMRSSCSLSMLHNAQFNVVRSSKSSDNLHRISNSRRTQTQSPQQSHKTSSSIFQFRKSRNKEKKGPPKTNNVSTMGPKDSLTQSWHSQANGGGASTGSGGSSSHPTPTKNILSFLRTRSRSNTASVNDTIVVSRPVPSCPSSTTVADFSHLRRRRPRSAHYDPNSITLPPKEDIPHHDVNELYERIDKLGEGSYATVYKCKSKADGSIVALKEIKLQFQEGLPFTAIREASLLRTLRHANIVCLHDIFLQHNQLTFVFEFMNMDLSKYLENYPHGLDNFQTKLLLFQLLRGLDFCHKKKILHRDLKPQNLLLDNDRVLKLADFGLARAKSVPSRTYSNEVVTLWYRPPDVLLGNTDYTTSLDMWGVGCIFAEICSGQALFPGTKDVNDQLDKIFYIRGGPRVRRWPEVTKLPLYSSSAVYNYYDEMKFIDVNMHLAKLQKPGLDLLAMFLQLRPDDRLSAASAMLHPYFQSFPPEVHILPPTQSIYCLPQLSCR